MGREEDTIVLHYIPIAHIAIIPLSLPILPIPPISSLFPPHLLTHTPHDRPTQNPQPAPDGLALLHADIAQFLPVGAHDEQDVATGDGGVVKKSEEEGC